MELSAVRYQREWEIEEEPDAKRQKLNHSAYEKEFTVDEVMVDVDPFKYYKALTEYGKAFTVDEVMVDVDPFKCYEALTEAAPEAAAVAAAVAAEPDVVAVDCLANSWVKEAVDFIWKWLSGKGTADGVAE